MKVSFRKIFIFACLFFMIIFVLFFKESFFEPSAITDVSEYNMALKKIKQQNEILHFPPKIPYEVKDVKLYCLSTDYNGELFLLQFKTNKQYIVNELKKFSFINEKFPVGEKQIIYSFPQKPGFLKAEKITFYVLKNTYNEQVFNTYFPYFSGIGVDKKFEHIIYYYINPAE